MCFLPETLPRIVIARAVKKSGTADPSEIGVMEAKVNVGSELRFVATMAFRIMFTEPIVILLALYNGMCSSDTPRNSSELIELYRICIWTSLPLPRWCLSRLCRPIRPHPSRIRSDLPQLYPRSSTHGRLRPGPNLVLQA